jgi:glycerol kinase
MQFQADMLGHAVVCPQVSETTALGAAYAAGLAVGYWASREDVKRHWNVARRWSPAMADAEREQLYRNWQKAVGRTLDWLEV